MANPTISKRGFIQSIVVGDLPSNIPLSLLAAGSNGTVLKVSGGVTTTGKVTDSEIADDSIAVSKIAKSTANFVMKTNAAGTATEQGLITKDNIHASAGILGTQIASGAALASPALTTPTISNLTTYGDLLAGTGSAAITRLAMGTKGYGLLANAAGSLPLYEPMPRKNFIINGDMRVCQRVAVDAPIASIDTEYQFVDKWQTLSAVSGNQTLYKTTAWTVGSDCSRSSAYVSSVANGGKHGIIQWLSAEDSAPLRGQVVSLSMKAGLTDVSLANFRMGIVQKTSGVADTIITDPINAWNAAGTNPTLKTVALGATANQGDLSFANTPASISLGGGITSYKVENITISSSALNIGVMLWSDATAQTAAAVWFLTDVQLERGSVSTAFDRIPFTQQLANTGVSVATPTIVVAAADSSAQMKALANFVCTGTSVTGNDQLTINTALAALPSGGGKLVMAEGTYYVGNGSGGGGTGSGVATQKANTSIEGSGWGTIIKKAGNTNATCVIINHANSSISNIQIDDNRASASATGGSCLGIAGVAGVTVINVWMNNGYTAGCYTSPSSTGTKFIGCRVTNAGYYGYNVAGTGLPGSAFINCLAETVVSEAFLISGNYSEFINCTAYNSSTGYALNGIGNIMMGCIAATNAAYGAIVNSGAVAGYNTITGNLFYNNAANGLYIVSGTGNSITGNSFFQNSTAGGYEHLRVDSSTNSISGNTFRKGTSAGVTYSIVIQSGASNCYLGDNDTFDGGTTGEINDLGTSTRKAIRAQTTVAAGDTISVAAVTTFTNGQATLPANVLKSVGKVIRIKAWGTYTTASTQTLQFILKAGSTALLTFDAVTPASGVTARRWSVEADLTIQSVGASGTIECAGIAMVPTANDNVTRSVCMVGGASVTIDTTASQTFQLTTTQSGASNSVTLREFLFELIG